MYHLLLTQAEQICLAQEQVIQQPEVSTQTDEPQEPKARQKRTRKTGEPRKPARLPKYEWTDEAIQNLIDLRYEKVKTFKETGQVLSLQNLWLDVPARLGVVNKLTADRACKKWNQLVNKYKDIQLKMESGTCSEEEKSWPYSAQIREILEEQWTFPSPPEDSEFDLVQLAYETRSTKHAKRVRSDIWHHFVRLNNKFARCRMCERVFSFRSTVSNLRKHLLLRHLSQYANLPPPQEILIECENIRDAAEEKKKRKKGSPSEMRVRRSAVWNYFNRLDDSYAECNVCKDTFSYRSSISNLMRHRRNAHPNYKTNFTPIRTFKKMGSKLLGPVKARPPEMKCSFIQESTADDSLTENQVTPSTDALQTVREQGSPGVKPSYLWNFFTIIDKNFAECNMCQHKLVYRSGMSNLAKHQRINHPLTQSSNTPQQASENPCEDDPLSLPEDHPTIQITDVQSADADEHAKEEGEEEETKSRKYSYIWNFFRDLGGGRAECRVCRKTLSYRASAFNLMKHRQLVHPDQPSFRIVEEGGEKRVVNRQTPRRPKIDRRHRKRSRVWQFFEYMDATYARCKMCRKELSHRFTSTNLLHHKNRMHPDTPLDYFAASEEEEHHPTPPESDNNEESSDDGGPGFDPPDANDSSDDNQDTDLGDNRTVEAECRSPPEDEPKVKRRRGEKWSSVWRLFDRLDEKRAKCKTCQSVYMHRSTNTNLRKHVRTRHPDVFRRFEKLRNDRRRSALFDECFPPPNFPPPPPANKPPPRVSSSTTPRRPEIVITIANNDQQPHAYNNNESPYTLPIIFIHDDQQSKQAKAAQTARMPPSHNNSGYAINSMNGSYGHIPPGTAFTTFENSCPMPVTSGNNPTTLIQNIGGNISHNPALCQNMGHNPTLIQNLGDHHPQLIQNMGGNNPTLIQNMGHNPTLIGGSEYPAVTFENSGIVDMSGNSGQVAGDNATGPVATNDRLLSMVKESNQLLRGMHSAIQRQSDVLCKLAESIDAMRARNREEMLTD